MIKQLSKTNLIHKTILLCICLLPLTLKAEVFPIQPPQNVNGQYEISTLAHLRWVSETTSAWGYDYILTSNIDATETSTWDAGNGFMPIGIGSNIFTGNINGKGFVINNLYIDRPFLDFVGLVGNLSKNSTIKNLSLTNCRIGGKRYVGGIVASNKGSIVNCHTTGTIIGSDDFIGGIVGLNDAIITRCSSGCAISCGEYGRGQGGLVGQNQSQGIISYSFATGNVSGLFEYVGGFVGTNQATINNCYATGQVNGKSRVGGFAGYNNTTILNSYAIGSAVSSEGSNYGGFYGFNNTDGKYKACYYKDNTRYQGYGTEALTIDEFAQTSNFKGWEFGYPWSIGIIEDIVPNNAFPYFAWQFSDFRLTLTIKDNGGNLLSNATIVTNSGTFVCSSNELGIAEFTLPNGIYNFVVFTNTHYKAIELVINNNNISELIVLENITLSSENYNGGTGLSDNPYQIDNLAQLRRLSMNKTDWDKHFKLTSNINASETRYWNININSAIEGFSPIGDNSTNDVNSFFTGSFTGQGFVIDSLYIYRPESGWIGLFGVADIGDGNIEKLSITNANITGHHTTGIICGRLIGGNTLNCSAVGQVKGAYNVGGLIGVAGNNSNIDNCFTIGICYSESNYPRAGGLVGQIIGSTTTNSYSSMYMINNNATNYFGGLIGENHTSTISGSYRLSGNGLNSEGIGIPLEHFGIEARFSGWDFSHTWEITQVPSLATGYYPYFKTMLNNRKLLSLSAEDANGTDVAAMTTFTGEGHYLPGEQVNITATYNESGYAFSWYEALTMVSDQSAYSFTMPDADLSLVAVRSEATNILEASQTDIAIYPNPARDYIILRTTGNIEDYQIYSANGVMVQSGEINHNETRIDLNGCSSGVYFIKVGDLAKKFVVK